MLADKIKSITFAPLFGVIAGRKRDACYVALERQTNLIT
jgi:hypothetical protein